MRDVCYLRNLRTAIIYKRAKSGLIEMVEKFLKRRRVFSRFCFFPTDKLQSKKAKNRKKRSSKRGQTRWCQFCEAGRRKVVLEFLKRNRDSDAGGKIEEIC